MAQISRCTSRVYHVNSCDGNNINHIPIAINISYNHVNSGNSHAAGIVCNLRAGRARPAHHASWRGPLGGQCPPSG